MILKSVWKPQGSSFNISSWTPRSVNPGSGTYEFSGVAAGGDRFILAYENMDSRIPNTVVNITGTPTRFTVNKYDMGIQGQYLARWPSFANNKFILAGYSDGGNSGAIYNTTNGTTWTIKAPEAFAIMDSISYKVVYGNGLYLGVGVNREPVNYTNVATSTDGLNFTGRYMDTESQAFIDVDFGLGRFVIVAGARDNTNRNRLITTTNGQVYTNTALPANTFCRWVKFGNDVFIALANTNFTPKNTQTSIIRTVNGSTFTRTVISKPYQCLLFHENSQTFIFIGNGISGYSKDGIEITEINDGPNFDVDDADILGNQILALNGNGSLATANITF